MASVYYLEGASGTNSGTLTNPYNNWADFYTNLDDTKQGYAAGTETMTAARAAISKEINVRQWAGQAAWKVNVDSATSHGFDIRTSCDMRDVEVYGANSNGVLAREIATGETCSFINISAHDNGQHGFHNFLQSGGEVSVSGTFFNNASEGFRGEGQTGGAFIADGCDISGNGGGQEGYLLNCTGGSQKVTRCKIHDGTGHGIKEVGCTSGDIELSRNVLYNLGSAGGDAGFEVTRSCTIANNTVYDVQYCLVLTSNATNVVAKNNIFRAPGTGAIFVTNGADVGLDCDYNCFEAGSSGFGYYKTGWSADLAAWQAASNQDANSIDSDPELFDPEYGGNLKLRPTSPCRGAGTTVSGIGTTDMDGFESDSGVDIGCYNFDASGVSFSTSATRTSGDTPLSVQFASHLTVSSQTTLLDLDGRTFWFFYEDGILQDTRKGTNIGKVFDTTNTWTVSVVVIEPDGTQSTSHTAHTITPTAFDGTTYVIAGDGDFTGAPSGTQVTTSDWRTAFSGSSRLATDTQFLFKRGETYTSSQWYHFGDNDLEGVRVGAWGTGTGEDATYGWYANDPVFSQASGSWPTDEFTCLVLGGSDIAFEHINFTAVATTNYQALYMIGSSRDYNVTDTTMWRCQGTNSQTNADGVFGFHLASWTYQPLEGMTYRNHIENCTVGTCSGISVYFGGEQCSFFHNKVGPSTGSHLLRSGYTRYGDISENEFDSPYGTAADGRHGIKLHAPNDRTHFTWTEFVNISGNRFTLDQVDSTGIDIAPQDSGQDEWLRRIVVDGNGFTIDADDISKSINWCQAEGVTVRNNWVRDISWQPPSTTDIGVVYVNRRYSTGITPQRLRILNNLMYSDNTVRQSTSIALYQASQDWDDVVIAGNIIWASGRTEAQCPVVVEESTAVVPTNPTLAANLKKCSDTSPALDFDWTNAATGDFTIGADSDAIAEGSALYSPLTDADNGVHNATPDAGPYGYNLTTVSPGGSTATITPYARQIMISRLKKLPGARSHHAGRRK